MDEELIQDFKELFEFDTEKKKNQDEDNNISFE